MRRSTPLFKRLFVLLAAAMMLGSATAEQPVVPPKKKERMALAGAHILISYHGARRSAAKVKRSKARALSLAKKVAALAKRNPKDFAQLARKYSDGPTASRGGNLGSWKQGQMVKPFDNAMVQLKIGQVAGPVETVFGYHVILRNPLPQKLAGAHILVAYANARRARPNVTRTRAEAFALASKIAKRAQATPAKFGDLARIHSDGPSAPRGGDLGSWKRGRMVPAFDAAMGKLRVGQVSGVVETPFGFHVLLRK